MFGRGDYKVEKEESLPAGPQVPPSPQEMGKAARLASLDAYRGLIMILLAGAAFGLSKVAAKHPDDTTWQTIAFHVTHPDWMSQFGWIGVSFWDLIQPAFMFMVGVAVPFSLARRKLMGQSATRRVVHCLWRCLVLVALGVFLQSRSQSQTLFEFTNVLAQIGLGYGFVYLMASWKMRSQLIGLLVVLVGCWTTFFFLAPDRSDKNAADALAAGLGGETAMLASTLPGGSSLTAFVATTAAVSQDVKKVLDADYQGGVEEMHHPKVKPFLAFSPWLKGENLGSVVDDKLLNVLPRPDKNPYEGNAGGYQTLNFFPSIGTMLLGLLAGGCLQSRNGKWNKFMWLVLGGALCMAVAIPTGLFVCPIVKRIWTPSWVLYSGAWVIWGLAIFYFLFDLLPLKWLAFPMIVVGMNSLLMYMMGQLLRPWITNMMEIHLDWVVKSDSTFGRFGAIYEYATAFLVMWLLCFWLYRKKLFIRV